MKCFDCGSKVYNGACTNCHEEIYIETQYLELGEPIPKIIEEAANAHRKNIKNKKDVSNE